MYSGKPVLRTEISWHRDLRVLQFCFYLCSPTFNPGIGGGECGEDGVTAVKSWTAVGELQIFLLKSLSPFPGIRSWTVAHSLPLVPNASSNILILNRILVANPCFAQNVWGAQKSHGCGQSVHGKSQNFLKHNVSCKFFWVIQAHSKS